jgi:GntR family transcriptional regulator/MocR family aminotransferase
MNTNLSYSVDRIQVAVVAETKPGITLYTALYRGIKNCIISGELPENWRLPSTRKLADMLNLSRSTVITSYELLQLEKLIVAKTGSGYRVAPLTLKSVAIESDDTANNLFNYPSISEKGQKFQQNVTILNRRDSNSIIFKPGLPPIDIFPINRWKNLLNNYWRYIKASELSYGQTSGAYHLKYQICNYLKVSRSINVSPEQVVVVSGSLQSIYLTASALINKGDGVVLENLTFPNVHAIFKSFSAQLIAIDTDQEGLQIDALKRATANQNFNLVHIAPSNNYPMSTRMSLDRRKALLQFCSDKGAYIIENDFEHEVGNIEAPLPTLFSLDKQSRVIYLGTFNRLLYPSIRLGFMLVPKQLTDTIAALQEHSHRFVSPAAQMVMGQFIEKGYLYQHLNILQKVAQERFNAFFAALQSENLPVTLVQQTIRGLHAVLQFDGQVALKKEQQIINALDAQDIVVFPLSKCYVNSPSPVGLIIGYATVTPSRIKKFVKIMARTLSASLSH